MNDLMKNSEAICYNSSNLICMVCNEIYDNDKLSCLCVRCNYCDEIECCCIECNICKGDQIKNNCTSCGHFINSLFDVMREDNVLKCNECLDCLDICICDYCENCCNLYHQCECS